MITITIDGKDWSAQLSMARTMMELVELVKANIDPDRIISSVTINSQELADADWRVPLSVQGNSTIAFETGTQEEYVSDRLKVAPEILDKIVTEFSRARALYQEGVSREANAILGKSVDDLRAFVEWYSAMLNLTPKSAAGARSSFETQVHQVTTVCEQMFQQQLYQSWWALGETLQTKLEPQLGALRACCADAAQTCASSVQ